MSAHEQSTSTAGRHLTGLAKRFQSARSGARPKTEIVETMERLQTMSEEFETPNEKLDTSGEVRETSCEERETSERGRETRNEEPTASNKEMRSMKEKRRSAIEKLETSKEKLQPSNEELQTVNAELDHRGEGLARASCDLRNLFENSKVATLFVDKDLRIRNYTGPLTDFLHVAATDKGRPLKQIAHCLEVDDVLRDIKGVIRDRRQVQREVKCKDGTTCYTMHIQPARSIDNYIDGAVVTLMDVTRIKQSESLLAESERRQKMLLRELQHRVRNLLANVRGLAHHTYEWSDSVDEFYEAFDGRLQALGRAQTLLNRGTGNHVALMDLILEEFLAHAIRPDRDCDIEGPEILLEPRAAQTFAVAINELTTNAVKYGALHVDTGHISVHWEVEDRNGEPFLILDWRETGVELDKEVGPAGFGRQLIEEALPYELGGKCRLEFPQCGCHCIMEIPFNGRIKRAGEPDADTGRDEYGSREGP